jgi:O-antigen ligase
VVWHIQGFGLLLLTFLSFFPRLFHLTEYLFLVLSLLALGTAWRDGTPVWVRTQLDLPLALFAGWVLLTIPFSLDPSYSFGEWRKLVTQLLVFYWVLLVLRHDGDGAVPRLVLAAVAVGATLLFVFAFADFLERGGSWKDRYVRAGAPSSDYNWLSTYMVMALPVLASAALAFRSRWQRIVYAGAAILALFSQMMSYTRAGWLGMAAQGLALGPFTGRRRLALGVLAGCLMIVMVVGLLAVSQTGFQRDTLDPWTLNARLAVWKLVLGEVKEHPVLGVGYGNDMFMKRFAALPETTKANGYHSAFLMVAMGSGIPALLLLIWVLASAVRSLVSGARHVLDREKVAVMVGIAIMVVGFAVRNLFDYMFAGSLAYLFWILVATGLAERPVGESVRSA